MVEIRSLTSGKSFFGWFVHSHQLYANLLRLSFLCALGSTLAFYLFKCKHFKAGHIPSGQISCNQECLPFPPPTPPPFSFKKTYEKMFHCETEEKYFLVQRKCSVMFRKTNYSYDAILTLKLHIHVGLKL